MPVTYPIFVLDQHLIVATDGNQEQDYLNIIENVQPLLALRALSTNIEHSICEIAQIEDRFGDARSTESRTQNVLICGNVRFVEEPINVGEIAALRLENSARERMRSPYYARLSCNAYSLPLSIAAWTPLSAQSDLKATKCSGGNAEDAEISPSACTSATYCCVSLNKEANGARSFRCVPRSPGFQMPSPAQPWHAR